MELNQFIENFANQFDDTNLTEFKAETVFKDLNEWSSINAMRIVVMAYEEYSVVLNGEDIRNSNTIEDLYNLVKTRM